MQLSARSVPILAALAVLAPMVSGCSVLDIDTDAPLSPTGKPVVYLDQGWSPAIREAYYYTPQGSRLLPYDWFLALEAPGSQTAFVEPSHLQGFGFLHNDDESALNPDGLPVGFAIDPVETPQGQWVGLTCAACHTGEIETSSARVRIDGGAALLDFEGFMAALASGLQATATEDDVFARFAARLSVADEAALRAELAAAADDIEALNAGNASKTAYGHGRLDAFGQIFNAVAGDMLEIPANKAAPDAPVSYPFLWNAPAQRYVQWNGVAGNPIGRNFGEVLGVFGDITLTGDPAGWYQATALLPELRELEDWTVMLRSPSYTEAFGSAGSDEEIARGEDLYKEHCQRCHHGIGAEAFTDGSDNRFGLRLLKAEMVPLNQVGTDPLALTNIAGRFIDTGPHREKLALTECLPVKGCSVREFLPRAVAAGIERQFKTIPVADPADRAAYFGNRFEPGGADAPLTPLRGYTPNSPTELAYKAGPLMGAWATAPFLHNGSVPSLDALLRPAGERPNKFYVGSKRYDPIRVGYVSEHDAFTPQERERLFVFDASLPGNSNAGHEFPAGGLANEADRAALIAYLKQMETPPKP